MIIGFIGPEGGGKTASMTWTVLRAYASGQYCFAFEGYEAWLHKKDENGKIVDSNTVTWEIGPDTWAKLDDSLENGFLAIDQIERYFGAEQWMGLLDRLFGDMCQQRRKLNMTIAYTTHNLMWINNRIRKETHLAVFCRDLYWDSKWRPKGLKKGELCHWSCVDNLGLFGHQGQVILRQRLPIKPYWDCYDSYRIVNPWLGYAKGVIKHRPKVEIDLGAPLLDQYDESQIPDSTVDLAELIRGNYD